MMTTRLNNISKSGIYFLKQQKIIMLNMLHAADIIVASHCMWLSDKKCANKSTKNVPLVGILHELCSVISIKDIWI